MNLRRGRPRYGPTPAAAGVVAVSVSALLRVLSRNADEHLAPTPEGRLLLAVIGQALADGEQQSDPHEARRFFVDGRMDAFAERVGLNPQFVRETVARVRPWLQPRCASLAQAMRCAL